MKVLIIILVTNFISSSLEGKSISGLIKKTFSKVQSTGEAPCPSCEALKQGQASGPGEQTCKDVNKYEAGPEEKTVEQSSLEPVGLPSMCREYLDSFNLTREDLDLCQNSDHNRYDKDYVSASPLELRRQKIKVKESPWILASKKKLEARVDELSSKAGTWERSCCGHDPECLRLIQTVPINYCDNPDARKHPNHPDYCSDLAYFSVEDQTIDEISNMMAHPEAPLRTQIISIGEIIVSPYYQKIQGQEYWMDSDLTLAHEFGHACRMARLVQSLRAQDPSIKSLGKKYFKSIAQEERNCEITKDTIDFYHFLAKDAGEYLTPTIIDCVANFGNFGKDKCQDNCPAQVLDESYANLVATTAHVDLAYPNFCTHNRDSQHAFLMDELECVAKYSPNFRESVKEYWQCP